MSDTPELLPRSLWVGIILLLGFLFLACLLSVDELQHRRTALPVIGQIADFTLTNEDGTLTTLADLTNHVWVADIIFTRCDGPCPRMTGQMKSVQDGLPENGDIRLVTLTTDPGYDSPEILKRYGEHFDADFKRWMFLTGTKAQIANLAAGSLKLGSTPIAPADQKNSADLFIHTTIFVLIDKHARMRGIYQTGGEDVDWTKKTRPALLAGIRRLEREP
ncbi:MAG TPA: SCO family protein [Candidatus Acidoferrales bacterium]|jgi:protein SCO1/2|nr:SCO family protein [Candidatus Acidoferrales bacterium]